MVDYNILKKRLKVESEENWDGWLDKIPCIRFPEWWNVQIIPPFRGAMIRFRVKKNKDDFISVYLDVYGRLGAYGSPYWEVYPVNDNTERIPMRNTKKLINIINKALCDIPTHIPNKQHLKYIKMKLSKMRNE